MSRSRFDDNTLLAYAEGRLKPDMVSAVEQFCAADSDAQATVDRYRRAAQIRRTDDSVPLPSHLRQKLVEIYEAPAMQPRENWLTKLQRIIAELTFDSRVQPAMVGYRSDSDQFHLVYESEAGEIDLQGTPMRTGRGDRAWQLVGQLTSDSSDDEGCDYAVALSQPRDTNIVGEARADDRGVFILEATSGSYDLHLQVDDDRVVTIENIELR